MVDLRRPNAPRITVGLLVALIGLVLVASFMDLPRLFAPPDEKVQAALQAHFNDLGTISDFRTEEGLWVKVDGKDTLCIHLRGGIALSEELLGVLRSGAQDSLAMQERAKLSDAPVFGALPDRASARGRYLALHEYGHFTDEQVAGFAPGKVLDVEGVAEYQRGGGHWLLVGVYGIWYWEQLKVAAGRLPTTD